MVRTEAAKSGHWTGFNGVSLAGDIWGPQEGNTVMLLHGGGQTRHAWRETGSALGRLGYRVIAYDARGHGDSSWDPDGVYTQDAMVSDLIAVNVAMGGRPPILIGASMGGVTSLIAIGEEQVRAAALVLVDIAPHIEMGGVGKVRQFMAQNPEGFSTLEDVADAISKYQPHRTKPRSIDGVSKNVRQQSDGRYHWHWDPLTRVKEMSPEVREARLAACARNLTVPVLLVRGSNSDLLSEEGARDFLSLCPTSEYAEVAGAAHMVAGDKNDAFGAAVTDFLVRRSPPATS